MEDSSFAVQQELLFEAVRLLSSSKHARHESDVAAVPSALPQRGMGEEAMMSLLAPLVLGGAAHLDAPEAFAHMDPPTPWLTWVAQLWNARLNQNLLHPATAPVARVLEKQAIDWLSPFFGKDGGHMVPGSTVANLTAIWAARERREIEEVAASATAHISIEKAAKLLGLRFRRLETDRYGRLIPEAAGNLKKACLVLVAGSTATGVVDPLSLAGEAPWTHVDAAWAGPLRLSDRHAGLLSGIEQADSISISGHKWFFQPKESAMVLFRDSAKAHAALTFGGSYLAAPNVGLLGSHGATAIPLLALLWAWGKEGLQERLERCMDNAAVFAAFVRDHPLLELLMTPVTGVVIWRPRERDASSFLETLPAGLASEVMIAGDKWLRCVAANPVVDIALVVASISSALR